MWTQGGRRSDLSKRLAGVFSGNLQSKWGISSASYARSIVKLTSPAWEEIEGGALEHAKHGRRFKAVSPVDEDARACIIDWNSEDDADGSSEDGNSQDLSMVEPRNTWASFPDGNDPDSHYYPLSPSQIPSVDVLDPPSPQSQVPQMNVLTSHSPVPRIPEANLQDASLHLAPLQTPLCPTRLATANGYSRSHINVMDNHFTFPPLLPPFASIYSQGTASANSLPVSERDLRHAEGQCSVPSTPTLTTRNMLIGPGLGLYPADWQCSPHHSARDDNSVLDEDSSNHVNGPDHAAPLVHGTNMFAYQGFVDGSHYIDPLTTPSGLVTSRDRFLTGPLGRIDGASSHIER